MLAQAVRLSPKRPLELLQDRTCRDLLEAGLNNSDGAIEEFQALSGSLELPSLLGKADGLVHDDLFGEGRGQILHCQTERSPGRVVDCHRYSLVVSLDRKFESRYRCLRILRRERQLQ